MIQTKCINGHYFDCEEYEYCPVCGAVSIEKDRIPDGGKKKSGITFPFIKPKTPSTTVKAEPVPLGRVDKTFGILGLGKNNPDRVPTQTITEGGISDYNSSTIDFDIDDEMYAESDPVIMDNDTSELSQKCSSPVSPQIEPVKNQQSEAVSQGGLGQQFANAQAKTVGFFSVPSTSAQTGAPAAINSSSDSKTVSTEPVVGWLVSVKGEHLGECFNIYSGKSSMGRSQNNRIVFSKDGQISREKHAFIMYEPKKREFFIQSGDSSGLTYLNDENVIGSKKINAFDIIELGGSQFVFVPLCCEKFAWESYLGK